MMSGRILGEFQVVGIAVFNGAVITFVYDLIRIFRRFISHSNFWIGVEDFLFWMWTAFWSFAVLYRENDGSLRLYTILSMTIGMIVYHRTISEPLVNFFGNKLKIFFAGIIMKLIHNRFICPWRRKHGDKS